MLFAVEVIICLVLGYFFGCFSTGYVVGKANHLDIREYGSGNVGTTNALRTLGKKAAAITLAGDIIKCVIPVLLVRLLIFSGETANNIEILALYTGLGTVIGHNFPFYMHFKGGKGIAAMSGSIIMFGIFNDPKIIACELLFFILIVAITRYVSLGSLLISIVFPIWVFVVTGFKMGFGTGSNIHITIVAFVYTISAFYCHRANIKRLISGTERKIGEKVQK